MKTRSSSRAATLADVVGVVSVSSDEDAAMTGVMEPKASSEDVISISATMSTTSGSSTGSETGSDSETESEADSIPSASSSNNTNTTGLKRRLRGNNNNNNSNNAEEEEAAKNTVDVNVDAKGKAIASPQPQQDQQHSYTIGRWMEFLIGACIFLGAVPLVVCQIVCCTGWEMLDQHTFKVTNWGTWLNEQMASIPLYQKLVHHPKDTFIINTTLWLGLVLPSYFFYEAYTQYTSIMAGTGFLWWRAAIYNIVRIGPMYRHFMFVYVLCHKEAHSYGKLFAEPLNSTLQLSKIYNYFIGFFHGVLPGPFTESHIYNHHKYDNDQDDVYSTGAFPRDSFTEFLRYVYVWFLYALNISSIAKFYQEGKMERVYRSVGGTLYYVAGVSLAAKLVGLQFAGVYILYPLIEGNILLSAVNYTWHAFIDPNDHDNDYVNSVTIIDGLNFTLDEEYHVVHHQVRAATDTSI